MSAHSEDRERFIGEFWHRHNPTITLFHHLPFSSFCGLWSSFPKIVFFMLCCSQWEGLRGTGSSLTKCIQQSFLLLLLPLLLPLTFSSFPSSSSFQHLCLPVWCLSLCSRVSHWLIQTRWLLCRKHFTLTLCPILFLHTKIFNAKYPVFCALLLSPRQGRKGQPSKAQHCSCLCSCYLLSLLDSGKCSTAYEFPLFRNKKRRIPEP